MLPTRWPRSVFPRRHTPTRPRPPIRRLSFEPLEDRTTPSTSGLLDPTFGTGGIDNLPPANPVAVVVQPDGKIVVAENSTRINSISLAANITVMRLNPDGTLDKTFNRTGSLTIQTGKADFPTAVALQPDGKILVGGGATANNGSDEALVARVNAGGTLDSTFGSKGLWLSSGEQVKKLAVLTDPAHPGTVTGIIAAAQGNVNGTACFEAIKLTPAGRPDATFGAGGFAVLAGVGNELDGLAVAPSGEIYLAGGAGVTEPDGTTRTTTGCLAAVTPSGSLDPSFGAGVGYVLADPTGAQGSHFYDVAVQTMTVNGQAISRVIVAGGTWTLGIKINHGLVSGYTASGILDATFGQGGTYTTAATNPADSVLFESVALEADGSVVVGGIQIYTADDGTMSPEMLVGHVTADGAADTSFGAAGTGLVVVRDGYASRVYGVGIDPTTGDVLAVGPSTATEGGTGQAAVVRLTAP